MDDVVIIAPDRETAREWLAKIKAYLDERLHLETNSKTKIFSVRQGVNAYGFKIKATHLMLRTETKRAMKRRIKKMVEKMKDGLLARKEVLQAVNSWLGFARWASAYNLAKKIFAPYRFIKVEGEMYFGYLSRTTQQAAITDTETSHRCPAVWRTTPSATPRQMRRKGFNGSRLKTATRPS